MKITLIGLLMFLLFSIPSFADNSYTGTGDDAYNSQTGSKWDADLDAVGEYFRGSVILSGGITIPLAGDMNNDGITEIVVTAGDAVYIFNNATLELMASLALPAQIPGNLYSNPVLFDLDKDGELEYIIVQEYNSNMSIIGYNGTHAVLEKRYTHVQGYRGTNATTAMHMIGCGGDGCAWLSNRGTYDYGTCAIYGHFVNATHNSASATTLTTNANVLYFPYIRSMPYSSINGVNSYIFSYATSETDELRIMAINYYDVTKSVTENEIFDAISFAPPDVIPRSRGHSFTSPTVMEFSINPGYEILVGYQISDDDFVMRYWHDDGTEKDRFPPVIYGNAEGTIISNVMAVNIFGDTGANEACIVGQEKDAQTIEIRCASKMSEASGWFRDSWGFTYDMPAGMHNLTEEANRNIYTPIAHAIDIEGISDGILTSWGVFDISELRQDYDDRFSFGSIAECFTIGLDCDIDLVWQNPSNRQSAFIPVDAQDADYDDLIALDHYNLFYYDDEEYNRQARFVGGSFDPCGLSRTVQVNSTLRIVSTVADYESDNINLTIYVYYGTTNQQVYSVTAASGTEISTLGFILNKTSPSVIIRQEARDIRPDHQADPTVKTVSFSVGATGVSYGDGCEDTWTGTYSETEEEDETLDDTNLTQEDINKIGDSIAPPDLIDSSYRPLYALLLMFIIGGAVLTHLLQSGVRDSSALIYLPLIAFVSAWIFAVFIGFISSWTIIVFILFASAFIGFKIYRGGANG